jgi:hypothetical protein
VSARFAIKSVPLYYTLEASPLRCTRHINNLTNFKHVDRQYFTYFVLTRVVCQEFTQVTYQLASTSQMTALWLVQAFWA